MQYFSRLFLEINYNFGIFALNGIIPLNNKRIFPNENSQSIWPDTETNNNDYGNHTNGIIHTISDSCAFMLNYLRIIDDNMLNYINSLYKRRAISIKQNKTKPLSAYIERVESCEYKRLGFQDYHYMQEDLNKSFNCLLITNKRGSPLAFIALRNHTFKGCSNGIMVSRFVIKPTYQRRGLSVPLLSLIGGMLKADGKRLFINTHLEGFGKALSKSKSFKGTTTDLRERKNTNDGKCKNRQSGIAYRKEFIGDIVKGYGKLFSKIASLRELAPKSNKGRARAENQESPVYAHCTRKAIDTMINCVIKIHARFTPDNNNKITLELIQLI